MAGLISPGAEFSIGAIIRFNPEGANQKKLRGLEEPKATYAADKTAEGTLKIDQTKRKPQ